MTLAAPISSPVTMSEAFLATAADRGDAEALRYAVHREGNPQDGSFADRFEEITYSWRDYAENARSFAKALIASGADAGDRVTIQGSNAPHWLFANVGTWLSGGVSAGSYPNNSAEASQHVALNCQARVIVVEDEEQLRKYDGMESTAAKAFVVWNRTQSSEQVQLNAPVYSWDEFLERGAHISDSALDQRIANQNPTDNSSLIYTSGTTGLPKGAVLSHNNLHWTARQAAPLFNINSEDRGLSYLPMSHIAAQMLDCVVPIITGSAVNIAASDALKGANLRDHITNTRPTYFLAIPRVWEKFKEAMELKLQKAPTLRRWLFQAASAVGRQSAADKRVAPQAGLLGIVDRVRRVVTQVLFAICNKLVYAKVHQALGLDRCRVAATGAAPISQNVLDFFNGIGLRIMDVYGMSECTGPATVGVSPSTPPKSCGQTLPGTEIRILDPDDNGEGEICVRGPHVFQGYWENPEKTAEAFDDDGYLRSGDKGRIDENGNVFITGRFKELIIGAGGENIPPVVIEQKLLAALPIVSQAVVVGNERPYLTVLLTLKTELDANSLPTQNLSQDVKDLLTGLGSNAQTLEEAAHDQVVLDYLQAGIDTANRQAQSRAQLVRKFAVLPEELSVANNLLTPTLKLKRNVITERFADTIEQLYV